MRDAIVVILRKGMFARGVGPRLLAMRGFLFLTLQELSAPLGVADPCEASCSQVHCFFGGFERCPHLHTESCMYWSFDTGSVFPSRQGMQHSRPVGLATEQSLLCEAL